MVFPNIRGVFYFLLTKCKINKCILISIQKSMALYTLFTQYRNSIIQKVSNPLLAKSISYRKAVFPGSDRVGSHGLYFAGLSGGEGKRGGPGFLFVRKYR